MDLFWNSSARDAIPIFYHTLHTQYLRTSLGPEKLQGSTVKVSNQPFPLTMAQKDLTDTQTSLFLALGFAFIPVSYGAFVVLEPGAQHLNGPSFPVAQGAFDLSRQTCRHAQMLFGLRAPWRSSGNILTLNT